jgi:hypothetical protein
VDTCHGATDVTRKSPVPGKLVDPVGGAVVGAAVVVAGVLVGEAVTDAVGEALTDGAPPVPGPPPDPEVGAEVVGVGCAVVGARVPEGAGVVVGPAVALGAAPVVGAAVVGAAVVGEAVVVGALVEDAGDELPAPGPPDPPGPAGGLLAPGDPVGAAEPLVGAAVVGVAEVVGAALVEVTVRGAADVRPRGSPSCSSCTVSTYRPSVSVVLGVSTRGPDAGPRAPSGTATVPVSSVVSADPFTVSA